MPGGVGGGEKKLVKVGGLFSKKNYYTKTGKYM